MYWKIGNHTNKTYIPTFNIRLMYANENGVRVFFSISRVTNKVQCCIINEHHGLSWFYIIKQIFHSFQLILESHP